MDDSLNPFARESTREAILSKRDRILGRRDELFDQRTEVLQHLRQLDRELSDCKAAARLFDLEIDFPEDDERVQLVRREAAMAADYQYRRLREQRLAEASQPVRPQLQVHDAISTTAASSPLLTASPAPPVKRPAIRDIVIEQLQLASPDGRKAADLRNFIEKTYGGMIHEKTVGMTLYRLSKDGLVRRDGHTWFFGSAQVETKNPGGDTPGPIDGLI